jgi:hypothetical protein
LYTLTVFDPIASLRLASNANMTQQVAAIASICKSDAIGGRYCIEKDLDAIVIHVDAIGRNYCIGQNWLRYY